jgi:hypothetical protein
MPNPPIYTHPTSFVSLDLYWGRNHILQLTVTYLHSHLYCQEIVRKATSEDEAEERATIMYIIFRLGVNFLATERALSACRQNRIIADDGYYRKLLFSGDAGGLLSICSVNTHRREFDFSSASVGMIKRKQLFLPTFLLIVLSVRGPRPACMDAGISDNSSKYI